MAALHDQASRSFLLAAFALLVACSSQSAGNAPIAAIPNGGSAGTSGSTGSGGNVSAGASGATGQCAPDASFASARLSLLTDDQYRNVVRDAFGVTLPPSVTVTTLPSTSGNYPYNESAQVATTTVQAYQRAADETAALMTSIPGCASGVSSTCFQAYLRQALPLAWRRPATDAELSALGSIFDSAAGDGPIRQVQLTVEAALLHPAFLYRSELGQNAATATGKVVLTPYELASALSFATLDSVPDPELWTKAQDGSIAQPSVLNAQVARLLGLPRVQANLLKKVSYYLDFEALPFVSKDAREFPVFSALQGTLYQSSQLFLKDIVWGGHFADLFTSRRIYANEAMATAFGLPAVSGSALQPITVTGAAYSAGLLTQPALLAASNRNAVGDDVVHRGLWIHDNLLCAPALPPPPGNAGAVAATIMGSSREQAMIRDAGCGKSCHGQFDAFGLVTLSYDGIGRFRTTDPTSTPPGGPIDTTATVVAGILQGTDMPVALSDVNDLANRLAQGRQVSDCTAEVLATYTLDHSPSVEGSCELQKLKDQFKDSGSFAQLFSAILTSPAFLTRDVDAQGK